MLRSQIDSQLVFSRCTRSSITDIVFPKFHRDLARKSFYCHGCASLFNSLPMNITTLYGTFKVARNSLKYWGGLEPCMLPW